MERFRQFRLALLLSGLISAAFAIGVPSLHIEELVKASDSVVVADVTNIRAVRSAQPILFRNLRVKAQVFAADLLVKRTIKGSVPSEFGIEYTLPTQFIGYRGLQSGTRLVFLHNSSNGWTFTDPYYPDFPAVSSSTGSTARSADNDVDSVLREMSSVISSTTSSPEDKLQILQVGYALPANEYVRRAIREGLSQVRGTDLEWILRSELVQKGDTTELPQIANRLLTDSVGSEEKDRLLYVIANSVTSPRGVPALQPLLRSKDDSLRVAAMEALWHIGSPISIESLVAGLNDPNHDVRYYAVRALARIAGQPGWEPSVVEFQEHEQKYLDYWKAWSSNT